MRVAFVLMALAVLSACGADGKPIAPGSKDAVAPVVPVAVAPDTGAKRG